MSAPKQYVMIETPNVRVVMTQSYVPRCFREGEVEHEITLLEFVFEYRDHDALGVPFWKKYNSVKIETTGGRDTEPDRVALMEVRRLKFGVEYNEPYIPETMT